MDGALQIIIYGWVFALAWIGFVMYTQGKGHPRSLFFLFGTEMWERFSLYGMRALLILYIISDVKDGGLGWTSFEAGQLYGVYTGLLYVTPILGGMIADRYLGYQNAIFIGGVLMVLGHASLAIDSLWCFYTGLGFLILGMGMFKPNISSMVGQLYSDNSSLKDSAYTIFYMGINLGAFLGTLTCGYLGEKVGWHYGFGAAGIGMTLGLILFYFTKKYLGNVGLKPAPKTQTEKQAILVPLTRFEVQRLWVIGVLSFFSILFWICFEQQGSSMNIFAYKFIDRRIETFDFEIPATFFQSLNPLFVILFAPLLSWIWMKLAVKNRNPNTPFKFALSFILLALGFLCLVIGALPIAQGATTASVHYIWLLMAYFLQTLGELCLSPVGLSVVNKLSPKHLLGLMFGVWFLASAFGYYVSGALAGMIDEWAATYSMSIFFGIFVAVSVVGAGLLLAFSGKLKSWMGGVN